jgi:tetratricopeptide (TPR) repeat protein
MRISDKKGFGFLSVLMVCLFTVSPSFGQISRHLNLEENSIEMRFLRNPDGYSLKDGAIIASGHANHLEDYRKNLSSISEKIRAEHFTDEKERGFIPWVKRLFGDDKTKEYTTKEKAKIVFDYLHRNVLKEYNASATTLDVTLRTGKYNCLTATLIYALMLDDIGVKSDIVALPTHIFSRIKTEDNKIIDIENSTPFGFDIGSSEDAQKNFTRITGFKYVGDSDKLETLDKQGVFSVIYANRAATAFKDGFPVLAFQNALKAMAVNPKGRELSPNVAMGYVAYSGELVKKGDFDRAVAILEEGIGFIEDNQSLVSNYMVALDGKITMLVREDKYDDAVSIAKRAREVVGRDLPKLNENLYIRILARLINDKRDLEKAFPYASDAVTLLPQSENIRTLLINGIKFLSEEFSRKPEDFSKNREIFIKWYGLMRSNEFVVFMERYFIAVADYMFNKGEVQKALEVVDEGLAIKDDSKALKNKGAEFSAKIAADYSRARDFPNAILYNHLGLRYLAGESSFRENLRILYREWAYHYIEKEEFGRAMEIVNEGLGVFPNEERLLYYKDFINRSKK